MLTAKAIPICTGSFQKRSTGSRSTRAPISRSEERRVGKECRTRRAPYHQKKKPPRLQGRMNSTMRFMVWGTIPLGTLLGVALATLVGLRETIVIGAIGGGAAFLWLLFSPQRHLHEMPDPIDDEAAVEEGLAEAIPSLGA